MSAAAQQRFIAEALAAHNECRRKHGVPDLEHNSELSRIAQSWASQIASRNTMQHSKNEYKRDKLGENIAMFYETNATRYDGRGATMQWYDEIKDYSFSRSTFISGTGHFTQVVWKGSKEVGFGVAQSPDGSFYAVANYYPAGNFIGQFKENVLPPSSNASPIRAANDDSSSTNRLRKFNVEEQPAVPRQPAAGKSGANLKSQFIEEALSAHNECRRKHGTPELDHNPELSKIAQAWANQLAARNTMQHSKNSYNGDKLGENIAMFYETNATHYDGKNATMQWYDEIKDYSFVKNNYIPGTGHFTQVVWKGSKEVGFGVAQSSDGSFYAVANYYPAGNFIGEFKENVLPPYSSSGSSSSSREKPVEKPRPPVYENVPKLNDREQSRFISEALAAHNECRRKHGVPTLEHSTELSKVAHEWAKNLASRNTLQHSKNLYNGEKLGENIAMYLHTGATSYDGYEATMQWYNEIELYKFEKAGFSPNTGHFTQVVWKSSQQVGFGVAQASDGAFYAVANYFPCGNMLGRFKENVLPVLQSSSVVDSKPQRQEMPPQVNETKFKEDFINDALRAHNEYRRKHSVAPLKLNSEISAISQRWAERIASHNKMQASGNKYNSMHLGENISMWGSTDASGYSGTTATKQWYDTIKEHDFSNDYSEKSGAFTQLVWKDSREVGFGIARAPNGFFYAVANYYPSGNYSGLFKQNVFRA